MKIVKTKKKHIAFGENFQYCPMMGSECRAVALALVVLILIPPGLQLPIFFVDEMLG